MEQLILTVFLALFALEFIVEFGLNELNLRHVQADHQHHRRRTVVVQPAHEGAEGGFMRDELQRFVGLRRGRDIRKGENDAAENLHEQGKHRGAAEHITPLRIARHDVFGQRANQVRRPARRLDTDCSPKRARL